MSTKEWGHLHRVTDIFHLWLASYFPICGQCWVLPEWQSTCMTNILGQRFKQRSNMVWVCVFVKALSFVNKTTYVYSLPFILAKMFGLLPVHPFSGWLWFHTAFLWGVAVVMCGEMYAVGYVLCWRWWVCGPPVHTGYEFLSSYVDQLPAKFCLLH